MKKNATEAEYRKKILSDNIKWYIDKIGMKKTNFAIKVGIQYNFLAELINEEKDPTPMMIEKLCTEMKVNTDELYFKHLPEIYDNEMLRTFGNNFRKIVRSRQLSLITISKETKIPQSTLSQWFNSVMLPRPNYFDTLSNYFKVPVSSLFCETTDNKKDYQLLSIVSQIPKGKEQDVVKFASLFLEQMLLKF